MKAKQIDRSAAELNIELRQWFSWRGLPLDAVWAARDGDLTHQNYQLRHLREWILAWERLPDREELIEDGFLFPPVGGAIDFEKDWDLFERWVSGDATPSSSEPEVSGHFEYRRRYRVADRGRSTGPAAPLLQSTRFDTRCPRSRWPSMLDRGAPGSRDQP
jgi:hypothetical protein